MKILFTGKGESASWQIRGVQLGNAAGADVEPMAQNLRGYDVIVGVKRLPQDLVDAIHKTGARFVWDIVDAFPQRPNDGMSRMQAISWFVSEYKRLRPDSVIWPNKQMAKDCYQYAEAGTLILPHHAWPGQPINEIRPVAKKVGYQGGSRYMDDRLRRHVEKCCAANGMEFVMKTQRLADVDVVLAFRGEAWNSYPQRNWKPGTKLNNAHASGTPFIGDREAGFEEIVCGGEIFLESKNALSDALEVIKPYEYRQAVRNSFLGSFYTLEDAASDFLEWINK